ncbi:MAG: COX15/CtaA family protein [Candidatus Sumerlaeaceae bacterium]
MRGEISAFASERIPGSGLASDPGGGSVALAWDHKARLLGLMTKSTAILTYVLLVAGSFVTSMKAALSDPTWPAFVGQPFPTKETFIGGLVFEDSHRVLAAVTGLATLLQAIALSLADVSRAVKKFAWFAVALVGAQAAVGGLVIHSLRNPYVSVVHGVLGQSYLATMMGLALVTSRWWRTAKDLSHFPHIVSIRRQMTVAAWLVFIQLLLGAGLRHSQSGFTPHLIFHIAGAVIVAGFIFFLTLRVLGQFAELRFLRRALLALSGIVILQMLLGGAAVFANRARPEPELARLHHVGVSVGHVALGAAILALTVLSALALRRVALVARRTAS